MAKPKLHLDADASRKALCDALTKLGHDVTRTPQENLPLDADDDYQLLWASAQGLDWASTLALGLEKGINPDNPAACSLECTERLW